MPYFVPASINAKLPPHAEAIEEDPTELEYGEKESIKHWSEVSETKLASDIRQWQFDN